MDTLIKKYGFIFFIILIISFGINYSLIKHEYFDSSDDPQFYARLCREDSCYSVHFWGQEEFIKYCNDHNGQYQVSSTTTCVEGKN